MGRTSSKLAFIRAGIGIRSTEKPWRTDVVDAVTSDAAGEIDIQAGCLS